MTVQRGSLPLWLSLATNARAADWGLSAEGREVAWWYHRAGEWLYTQPAALRLLWALVCGLRTPVPWHPFEVGYSVSLKWVIES